jgi:hypothetical protein
MGGVLQRRYRVAEVEEASAGPFPPKSPFIIGLGNVSCDALHQYNTRSKKWFRQIRDGVH